MFGNPIYKLVMARLKQMLKDAQLEYDLGRKALRAKLKEDEAELAEKLVSKIIRL